MAEPTPGAPAQKPGMSTFITIFAFGLILLIMFDPNARSAVGQGIGAVLTPLIGFGGRHYAWTLFFAGVILIVATTVIRHFLVDWVAMARTQEIMRTYQRELGEARKSNNSYRLKKLMDKQPEVMQLQADMSKNQLKPMLFTMVIVIPIFAWLSTLVYTPVAYGAVADDVPTGVFYFDSAIYGADTAPVDADAITMKALKSGRFVSFNLPGEAPGTVRILDPRTNDAAAVLSPDEALRIDWSAHRLANLTAGEHTLQVDTGGDAPSVTFSGDQRSRTTLAVVAPANGSTPQVLKLTSQPVTVNVDEGAVLYAVAPAPVEGAEGATRVLVDAQAGDDAQTFQAELVTFPEAGEHEVPHGLAMPWNEHWDLLHKGKLGSVATLPHWILLYSLFTIPFGQTTQKLLKLLEYRHAVEAHELES